jgi:outer membrane putative beta-barrel porin/alpha-amylase
VTRRSALVCAAVAIVSSHAFAQQDPHAVQPERPTVATHAGTVAPGWFEIETGVERDQLDPGLAIATPTTLKLGIGPRAQLSIWGSVPQPDSSTFGPGDLSIGVKWRLLEDAPVVGDFAILPSLKLPTGSANAGRGTSTTDVSLLLISSHDFHGVAMDLNAGYTRRSGDGTQAPKNATVWTASFGGPAYKSLGWVAELYGYPSTTGAAGQSSTVAVLAGPTYQPKKYLAVDLGLIVPVTGPQPHALYAGAVWNVGKVW